MIATIINVSTIILGGLIGVTFGNRIGEKYSKGLMTVIGLITFTIGIQNVMVSNNTLVVVICLVLGTLIGMLLKLDDAINTSGDWLKAKLSRTRLGSGRFGGGLIDVTNGFRFTLDGTGAGIQLFNSDFGASILNLPFGGFLTLGVLIAVMQYALKKSAKKKEAAEKAAKEAGK